MGRKRSLGQNITQFTASFTEKLLTQTVSDGLDTMFKTVADFHFRAGLQTAFESHQCDHQCPPRSSSNLTPVPDHHHPQGTLVSIALITNLHASRVFICIGNLPFLWTCFIP